MFDRRLERELRLPFRPGARPSAGFGNCRTPSALAFDSGVNLVSDGVRSRNVTPDQFPTLEAAAGLGLAIILVRTGLLVRTLSSIGSQTDSIVAHLQAGEREPAHDLAADEQADTFHQVARRVLIALRDCRPDEERAAIERHLGHAFDSAFVLQARRLQSGRARDWVALGILIGAVVFLAYAALPVSSVFYVLCAVGAVFLTLNVFLRGSVVRALRRGRAPLLKAATEVALHSEPRRALPSKSALQRNGCPVCGAPLERLGEPASLALEGSEPRRAALQRLSVCRHCGHVQGTLGNPGELSSGKSR